MPDPSPTVSARDRAGGSRRVIATSLLAVSLLTTVSTVFDLHWWGRPLLALAFFLLLPGWVLASSIDLGDDLAELTVGAALSVAISTLAAMVMAWCHQWHPAAVQVAIAVLSLPALVGGARGRAVDGPARAWIARIRSRGRT